MSLQLKVIAVFIIVIVLVFIQVSGCAAPAGSAAGKKVKQPEQIPLTPYQLRHATIGIPEGVIVRPTFYYGIEDQDKHMFMDVRIEICDGDDIQAYFDAEIAKLRQKNEIVNITKQETEYIGGNKALVLHITYKTNADFPSMEFSGYVGILCKNFYVLFKAWGFLDLFEPGEHLWQAMYRSFRSDNSQPYKLPFGSFILPKEARDRSRILLYFLTEEENEEYEEYADDESEYAEYEEDDYYFIIEYASDIKEAKKKILNFKHIMLMTLLGSLTVIRQNKTVKVGGKKGRYFEALVITPNGSAVTAFFLVPDGLKSGLKITIGSNNPKTFKRYRPQMKAILRSIKFDETAAGGEE